MPKQKDDAFLFSLQPQVKSSKPNTHQYANMRDRGNVEQIKARVDELVNFLNPDNRLSDASDNMSSEDLRVRIQQINSLARHFTLHQIGLVLNGLAELNRGNYRFRKELKKLEINHLIWHLDNLGLVEEKTVNAVNAVNEEKTVNAVNILHVIEVLRGCSNLTYDKLDLSWNPDFFSQWLTLNINSLSPAKALDTLCIFAKLGYDVREARDAPFVNLLRKTAKRAISGVEIFGPKKLVALTHSLAKTRMFEELFGGRVGHIETWQRLKMLLEPDYPHICNENLHALLQADLLSREGAGRALFTTPEEVQKVKENYTRQPSSPSYLQLDGEKELAKMQYYDFQREVELDPARMVDGSCKRVAEGRVTEELYLEFDGPQHKSLVTNQPNAATMERDRTNIFLLSQRAREERVKICYAVIPYDKITKINECMAHALEIPAFPRETDIAGEEYKKLEMATNPLLEPQEELKAESKGEEKNELRSAGKKGQANKGKKGAKQNATRHEEERSLALELIKIQRGQNLAQQQVSLPLLLKDIINGSRDGGDTTKVKILTIILGMSVVDINSKVPGSEATFLDYASAVFSQDGVRLAKIKIRLKIIDALVAAGAESTEGSETEEYKRASSHARDFFNIALNNVLPHDQPTLYNAASYILSKYKLTVRFLELIEIIRTDFVPLITKAVSFLQGPLRNEDRNDIWKAALAKESAEEIAEALTRAEIFPANDHQGLELAALALLFGIKKQNEAIVRGIVQNFAWEALTASNITPQPFLHHAVAFGDENIFNILIETGVVNIDARGPDNDTAFYHACRFGREAIVARLADIAKGLPKSLNSPDSYQNLLHSWLMERHSHTHSYLIHGAVIFGHLPIVKLLCNFAAELGINGYHDIMSNENETPLLVAIHGREDIVQYLISLGASITARNSSGTTILYKAALEGEVDNARALCEAAKQRNIDDYANISICADGAPPLLGAALEGKIEMVRYLIREGARVNDVDNNGASALHGAAQSGHLGIVDLLVRKGADINATTISERFTPLRLAVYCLHPEVCQRLIDAGASLEVEGEDCDLVTFAVLRAREISHSLPDPKRGNKTVEVIKRAFQEKQKELASTPSPLEIQPLSYSQLAGHEAEKSP